MTGIQYVPLLGHWRHTRVTWLRSLGLVRSKPDPRAEPAAPGPRITSPPYLGVRNDACVPITGTHECRLCAGVRVGGGPVSEQIEVAVNKISVLLDTVVSFGEYDDGGVWIPCFL